MNRRRQRRLAKKEDKIVNRPSPTYLRLTIERPLPLDLLLPPLSIPLLLIQFPLLLLLTQRAHNLDRLVLQPSFRLEVQPTLLLQLGRTQRELLDLLPQKLVLRQGRFVLDGELAETGFGRREFLEGVEQRMSASSKRGAQTENRLWRQTSLSATTTCSCSDCLSSSSLSTAVSSASSSRILASFSSASSSSAKIWAPSYTRTSASGSRGLERRVDD
jgi:hypothetical protein